MPTNAIRDQAVGPGLRALVITTSFPPTHTGDVFGMYQRLRMFVGAIDQLAAHIEMLHLMPEVEIARYPDLTLLQSEVSAYWGRPVSITLIPTRRRVETFCNHYLSGILRAAEQPQFSAFAGPDQAAAIGRHLDRDPDLVFVQQLDAMCAVLMSGRKPRNVFFDLDNIDHCVRWRWLRQLPLRPGKLGYLAHLPAMVCAEWQAAAMSRLMFVCSEADRRHLRRLGFGRSVTMVPNAVALPTAAAPLPMERTVMFLGYCDYRPNVEAAERLVYNIMPLVRDRVPDAMLLLAGKGTDALPSARAKISGVEHLGFVADLNELYARSRVICCPIVNGGGTRIKLIEAAAQGKPMISTRVGAEGLDFADGAEILLRDDDQALADACVQLLKDDAVCRRLGEAARRKAVRLYDAKNIQDDVVRLMREQVAGR